MAVGGVDVRVENQLVRFVPTAPVNHDAVISQLWTKKWKYSDKGITKTSCNDNYRRGG